MLTNEEKAYCAAMNALEKQDYPTASVFFRDAEKQFAAYPDFSILKQTTELLLAVKMEIAALEEK